MAVVDPRRIGGVEIDDVDPPAEPFVQKRTRDIGGVAMNDALWSALVLGCIALGGYLLFDPARRAGEGTTDEGRSRNQRSVFPSHVRWTSRFGIGSRAYCFRARINARRELGGKAGNWAKPPGSGHDARAGERMPAAPGQPPSEPDESQAPLC